MRALVIITVLGSIQSWNCWFVKLFDPYACSCCSGGGLDPVCDRCTWRGHRGRHPWQVFWVWRNQEPASQSWPQNRLPQGESNASLACLWVSTCPFHRRDVHIQSMHTFYCLFRIFIDTASAVFSFFLTGVRSLLFCTKPDLTCVKPTFATIQVNLAVTATSSWIHILHICLSIILSSWLSIL